MEVGEQGKIRFQIAKNFFRRRIDRLIIHPRARWGTACALFAFFVLRVLFLRGFYAAAYIFGFYVMQNVIMFLTPSGIPTIQDEENAEVAYEIPEHCAPGGDGSKPVVRKMGEFMLWKKLTLGLVAVVACTFFPMLDFPVFWPLLLVYFVFIVLSIGFKQYRHMKRYGYSFNDFFKKREELR